MKLKKLISRNNYFKIFPIYFFGLSLINFILSFLNPRFISDLDHELYFGIRMLDGDLIYINEIHDKLPFIPTLMTIPGFFKSEKPWILITTLLIFISTLYFYKSFTKIFLEDWNLKNRINISNITLISTSLIPYSISVLGGGILEINAFAVPSILISTCLFLSYSRSEKYNINSFQFLGSALFAAVGISLRPYYLLSIFILPFWAIGRKIIRNRVRIKTSSKISFLFLTKLAFIWLSILFVFGLILNLIPYVLKGEIVNFINGLQHISQETHQQSLFLIFKSQVFTILTSSTVAVLIPISITLGIYVNLKIFKNKNIDILNDIKKIDLICGSFLSMILLQVLIFSKHFWAHYYQLMIPYALISLLFATIYIVDDNKFGFYEIHKNKFFFNLISIFIIFLLFKSDIYTTFINLQKVNVPYDTQVIFNEVSDYLDKNKKGGQTNEFFFPGNMNVHWRLNQHRFGFPVAANINHIINNKWLKLEKKLNLRIPIDSNEYCQDLLDYGPETIFTYKNSFESNCLKRSKKFYLLEKESDFLSIFLRKKNQEINFN